MHIFGSFDSKQLFYIGFWVGSGGSVGMGSVYKLDMLVSKSGAGGEGVPVRLISVCLIY